MTTEYFDTMRPLGIERGEEIEIVSRSREMSATVAVIQARVPSETAEADAAHIVKCVNNHEALVAMLEEATELCGDWPQWQTEARALLEELKQ